MFFLNLYVCFIFDFEMPSAWMSGEILSLFKYNFNYALIIHWTKPWKFASNRNYRIFMVKTVYFVVKQLFNINFQSIHCLHIPYLFDIYCIIWKKNLQLYKRIESYRATDISISFYLHLNRIIYNAMLF